MKLQMGTFPNRFFKGIRKKDPVLSFFSNTKMGYISFLVVHMITSDQREITNSFIPLKKYESM